MRHNPAARLMAGAFLLWFSVYTYPPFLPAYAQHTLGATPVMVGAIVGGYGFTQMLLRIPLGVFSDMLGRRKPFLVGGMIASILSAAGLTLFKAPAGALIFRGLAGVAVSSWVAYTALYSALFSREEITHAMGVLASAQYGAHVAAMLLGGLLAQSVRPEAAFLLGALAAAAGLFTVSGVKEPKMEKTAPAWAAPARAAPAWAAPAWAAPARAMAEVARDGSLIWSALLATVYQFAAWGTALGFTANWASEVVGLGASQLGFLSATLLFVNTVLSRLSGPIARRFKAAHITACGFLLCAAASALFAFSYTLPALFAAQALFGAGMGLVLPVTVAGSIQNIPPEKRGAASGLYQSIYGMGMFLGPVTAGAIVKAFGYRANFFAMAGVLLAGACLSVLWRFTADRSSP